jgi:hypothetical protein
MTINLQRTSRKSPACFCVVCAARRASRLAHALEQKYGLGTEALGTEAMIDHSR